MNSNQPNEESGFRKLRNRMDPAILKICLYIVATVVVLYILYHISGSVFSVLDLAVSEIGNVFYLLRSVLWGFFLAYLLMPMTDFLQRRLANTKFNKKDRTCRTPAVALTIIIVLSAAVIFFSVLVSTFTSQIQIADLESIVGFFKGIATNIGVFYKQVQETLNRLSISSVQLQNWVDSVIDSFSAYAGGFGMGIMNGIETIPDIFSQFFFVMIFAIWFLLDGAGIALYWGKLMYALFSDDTREKIAHFLEDADQVFSGYIRGQMLDAVIMMLMISVLLSVVKVPFAVTIGVLAGIGNLIPYVGPFVAYGGVILVCLINGEISKMLLTLVFLWIIQSIDGNIINPKLLGHHVHIHPMYVIIVLIIGGAWGGLLGMLFAVPVGALLKLQFDRLVNLQIKRKIEREKKNIQSD